MPHAFPKINGLKLPTSHQKKNEKTAVVKKETYFFHANRTNGQSVSRGAVVDPYVLFRGNNRSPDEIVYPTCQDRKDTGGLFARGRVFDVADHVSDSWDEAATYRRPINCK